MNPTMLVVWTVFVSGSFVYFGTSCLVSGSMRREFLRYRLGGYRVLTGVLQLLGAAGLLVGLWLPTVGAAAAAGLTVLMLLGLGVRRRIGDPWPQQVPAGFYAFASALLVVGFLSG